MARIHAGLYNGHLNRPVDAGPPNVGPFFASAIEIYPEVGEAVRDYLQAMIVPGRAFLSAACRRNWSSTHALEPFAWLPSNLNGDVLEAMREALADRPLKAPGEMAAVEAVDRLLAAHHASGPRERDPSSAVSPHWALSKGTTWWTNRQKKETFSTIRS
jgi:hypothetical protein